MPERAKHWAKPLSFEPSGYFWIFDFINILFVLSCCKTHFIVKKEDKTCGPITGFPSTNKIIIIVDSYFLVYQSIPYRQKLTKQAPLYNEIRRIQSSTSTHTGFKLTLEKSVLRQCTFCFSCINAEYCVTPFRVMDGWMDGSLTSPASNDNIEVIPDTIPFRVRSSIKLIS